MVSLRAGDTGVEVEQAAGLGGGERDHPIAVFIRYHLRRAIRPRRPGFFSTGLPAPLFIRLAVVHADRRRARRHGAWPQGVRGNGEERVREHRQGDVPVPGLVEPYLVVVRAPSRSWPRQNDPPPPSRPRSGDQLGQRRAARRVAPEVRQLLLALLIQAQRPADQQPVITAGSIDQRPVIPAAAPSGIRARQAPVPPPPAGTGGPARRRACGGPRRR